MSDAPRTPHSALRTVFMGTPDIAVPALRVLAARTRVQAVVTQPDRPAGRGNRLAPPPVKTAALELGLPVWQPETLRGQAGDARLQGADLMVVMAFGQILRDEVLGLPRERINLHASLLPRWRGASPLQACLRAGDARTGISVMRMVRALDAGPVFLRQAIDLPADATLPWLHDRLAELAAEALGRFLDGWPWAEPAEQDQAQVTLCGKLGTGDGALRFGLPMAELERWVRAYTPAPGCWLPLGAERLRVLRLAPRPAVRLAPGAAALVDGEPCVGCADGAVALAEVQPPGKRAMPGADWARGHALPGSLPL